MKHFLIRPVLAFICCAVFLAADAQENAAAAKRENVVPIAPLDQLRVKQIAAMLPDQPRGMGRPYYDRAPWNAILASGRFNALVAAADSASMAPLPPMTDDIYLSFFNSNDSETSKRLTVKRRILFSTMVWAECLLNNGRYLPAIKAAIADFLSLKSWNFPAEDRKKLNFEGRQYTINLSPADYAIELANAAWLLADKLDSSTRRKIKEALYLRVFNPTLQAIRTPNANEEFTSLTSTGNHNVATLSGVTGAALATIENKEERAVFVAIAERYSKNYIIGFLDDGYCTEGLGYFNYGMRHFTVLRENIWQATSGKIDLFADPKMKRIAMSGPGMEIIHGIYPAIGDCEPGLQPDKYLMCYLNRNLQLGLPGYEQYAGEGPANAPLINLLYFFPNTASGKQAPATMAHAEPLRTYFNKGGLLTVRPGTASSFDMGATLKGGNNGEQHNHNDIGSFTIVQGSEVMMGDPGLATYTSKTFTKDRYSIKTLASWGHPVPVIGNVEQSTGAKAQAVITDNAFSAEEDRFSMDMRSAYELPGLKKMQRTFIYHRGSQGFLQVTDEIETDSPRIIETALTTRATWKQVSEDTIELVSGKQKMLVIISVPGNHFSIHADLVTETPVPYTRLGIRLTNSMQKSSIKMIFKPAS